MKKIFLSFFFLFFMISCSGPTLMIKEAQFVPSKVRPGDKVMFKIVVEDSEGVIDNIKSTWQRDSNFQVELNDKGEKGDKVAGDGVWSSTFNVPWNAPANVYYWDFTAHDESGSLIKISNENDEQKALKETVSVEVVR